MQNQTGVNRVFVRAVLAAAVLVALSAQAQEPAAGSGQEAATPASSATTGQDKSTTELKQVVVTGTDRKSVV